MKSLSFKQFIEFTEKNPNYVDVVQDELGIDPKALEKTPNWAANVGLGKITYNGIFYTISSMVKRDGQIVGAMIKPVDVQGQSTQRAYIKSGGKPMRVPDSTPSQKEIFIPMDKLNGLMSQGMSGAGGAAGMPPGGGLPI